MIAQSTRSHFVAFSAVLQGVKDIREVVAKAQQERNYYGRRTLLFIDEIHRFNKAQQDALLPWVENGDIILIGATTENPSFEVNSALLSRSRVFVLEPLAATEIEQLIKRALTASEGLGPRQMTIEDKAVEFLADQHAPPVDHGALGPVAHHDRFQTVGLHEPVHFGLFRCG